jgi:hypothetical protein
MVVAGLGAQALDRFGGGVGLQQGVIDVSSEFRPAEDEGRW